MKSTDEEQLTATRPISSPSGQSQYNSSTPGKEPRRFRFSPLKLFPNIRYYLNWREFFRLSTLKIGVFFLLIIGDIIIAWSLPYPDDHLEWLGIIFFPFFI